MKKIYGISFVVAALVITGAYYASFRYSSSKSEKQLEQRKQEKIQEEVLGVGKSDDEVVTNQTGYVLEVYDSNHETGGEQVLPMPAAFLGKNREELIEYLADYSENPRDEDIAGGFEKFELLSFSSSQIMVRKTYAGEDTEFRYCLMVEDGYLTVYHADMETLYTTTDIKLDILPEDVQEEIKTGKMMTEIEELYEFLENYTS